MTEWRSTLGAPLSETEADRIQDSWNGLQALCGKVSQTHAEPVEMLNLVTDLTLRSWEVRRAIGDAWFYANKRAARTSPSNRPSTILDTLNQLGLLK